MAIYLLEFLKVGKNLQGWVPFDRQTSHLFEILKASDGCQEFVLKELQRSLNLLELCEGGYNSHFAFEYGERTINRNYLIEGAQVRNCI